MSRRGRTDYYTDFAVDVFDCADCGCRFCPHADVADELHANPVSCYGLQLEMARRFVEPFSRGDAAALREALGTNSRYRHVIDTLAGLPKTAKLLEWGCSRGYLTSHFILAGHDIVGADVSKTAVAGARELYGDHFFAVDAPEIRARGPYDVIYHVGTIGCVADPVGMTRSLLGLLKPGGRLIFNAPNVDACWLKNQIWIDFSPPPDLVTLFKPGFWRQQFQRDAEVVEQEEMCGAGESFAIAVKRMMGPWRPPRPVPLGQSLDYYKGAVRQEPSVGERARAAAETILIRAGVKAGLTGLAKRRPTPYGLYVTMTKRAEAAQ